MRSAALFSALLATTSSVAFARPSTPHDKAAQRVRRSNPKSASTSVNSTEVAGAVYGIDYNTGWSGIAYNLAAGTFKGVSANFIVPTPRATGNDAFYSAAAWVGIDGNSCGSAILQTGIDFSVSNGQVQYSAWYEWYPSPSHTFDIPIDTGDEMKLWVEAYSKTSGIVNIENVTKNKKVSQVINAPASQPLCFQDAEWIVEDYGIGSGSVELSNWGSVTFRDAFATKWDGHHLGPRLGNMMDLVDQNNNNNILTSTSTTSDSVTITYI